MGGKGVDARFVLSLGGDRATPVPSHPSALEAGSSDEPGLWDILEGNRIETGSSRERQPSWEFSDRQALSWPISRVWASPDQGGIMGIGRFTFRAHCTTKRLDRHPS